MKLLFSFVHVAGHLSALASPPRFCPPLSLTPESVLVTSDFAECLSTSFPSEAQFQHVRASLPSQCRFPCPLHSAGKTQSQLSLGLTDCACTRAAPCGWRRCSCSLTRLESMLTPSSDSVSPRGSAPKPLVSYLGGMTSVLSHLSLKPYPVPSSQPALTFLLPEPHLPLRANSLPLCLPVGQERSRASTPKGSLFPYPGSFFSSLIQEGSLLRTWCQEKNVAGLQS